MIMPRRAPTPTDVAEHYNTLDPFYRAIWGEHVHHGYWRTGRETPAEAADALVDLVADRLVPAPGHAVCDIGCGYGATAQVLAERYGVAVSGVTLSSVQQALAARRVPARGTLRFEVRDWLVNDFPSEAFDRAYAIESTEHMADKAGCFLQAFRTVRPGGRLVVCAWLAAAAPRPWHVRHLLAPICDEGRLPALGTEAEYVDLLHEAGFLVECVEDFSASVARTWRVCMGRAVRGLLTEGRYRRFLWGSARDRVFAVTMLRMILAFRTGALRYVVLTVRKPG